MMRILIGTHNENKFKQLKRAFGGTPAVELLSLGDLKINDDVEEGGESLLENAKAKAKFYGEKSGLPALSDDLGLFIDALGGDPGVHAKRWMSGADKDRYMKILEKMKGIPEEKRTCRYKAVLAVYFPNKKKWWIFQHELEGTIAFFPKEGLGFGYDPIVLIGGKYYSQLTDE